MRNPERRKAIVLAGEEAPRLGDHYQWFEHDIGHFRAFALPPKRRPSCIRLQQARMFERKRVCDEEEVDLAPLHCTLP